MYSHSVIAGCPAILRGDHGTENSDVAAVHIALRYSHHDSLAREKSFIYREFSTLVQYRPNSFSELSLGGPNFVEGRLTGGLTYSR